MHAACVLKGGWLLNATLPVPFFVPSEAELVLKMNLFMVLGKRQL